MESKPGPSGDLLRRIQERYANLRRSERIVADYLRENAGRRLNASITELARLLGVSEATVSRVSRALGYRGYPDMKLSLAEGAGSRSPFSNIPVEIDEADPLVTTSVNLAMLFSTHLQGTQRLLDASRLEQAVCALRAASKVVFVGVGGSAAICDQAAHVFMKAGLDIASHHDGYAQVVAAANLDARGVMVGISHTGSTQAVANALRAARETGATTIAITGNPDSLVARAAAIVFTTWQSSTPEVPLYGDFLEGRIGQLFLIDVLYLGVLFADRATTSRCLDATAAALTRYYGARERGET